MDRRQRGALVSGLLALAAAALLVALVTSLRDRARPAPADFGELLFAAGGGAESGARPGEPDFPAIEARLRAALAEGDAEEAARLIGILRENSPAKVPAATLALLERAYAEGTALRRGESPYAVVSFDGVEGDEIGDEALALADRAILDLSALLAFAPERKIEIVVYSDPSFSNAAGAELPQWVGAAFDGKLRLPVELVRGEDPRREATVRHEMAHAFVHLMSGGTVPVWMDEGIAQHAEGRAVPECWSRAWAFPSMEELRGPFVSENDPVRAFALYASSLALLEHLVELREWRSVQAYLDEIRQGKPEPEAFAELFELTPEQAWADAQLSLATNLCPEPEGEPAEEPADGTDESASPAEEPAIEEPVPEEPAPEDREPEEPIPGLSPDAPEIDLYPTPEPEPAEEAPEPEERELPEPSDGAVEF